MTSKGQDAQLEQEDLVESSNEDDVTIAHCAIPVDHSETRC